ncbi:ATP-binding protein [Murimonas intestini]|uniref:ATP-binding protein n=1 Tax=Murimonas intestini TaxID=1337051 RepID=UPI001FAAA36C|nr:sensor histidine kinase [Murimonas intestini]
MLQVTPDLNNTPGIYYALAYIFSSCLYISLNKKRLTGKRRAAAQTGFAVLLLVFMIATDQIAVKWFIPCVLAEIGILWLSIHTCCDMDWKKSAYFCTRVFILGELAASLDWQLFYFGLMNWELELNMVWNLMFLTVSYGSVFGVMYLLERSYRKENEELHISGRELRVTVFLLLLVYMMSNMSYVFSNTPFSSQFPAEMFTIRTLVDLGGVGILFAYHMQIQEINVKLENAYLQNMLHSQYENYKISEESIALVNQKYHDLKHQIAFLRSSIDDREKETYLNQMEQEIKLYEAQNKTGNKVLDTILTAKTLQCQNQGISLTCVADGEAIEFMHPMDITALFGNALDNAIESVKKIADPEKRLIHMVVSRQKNFLRIKVENCYEGTLEFENGMPKTTKLDKKFHGYGMKSIKTIVEKYSGSVTVLAKDGWFELRILISRE